MRYRHVIRDRHDSHPDRMFIENGEGPFYFDDPDTALAFKLRWC